MICRLSFSAVAAVYLMTSPLLAQSLEDRTTTLVTETQLAAATPYLAERRDRLVTAAYEARRIVEDAPESEIAERLTGSGIEVSGADPIRYVSLQDQMTEACIALPNALCLTDMAYVIAAREAEVLLVHYKMYKLQGARDEIIFPARLNIYNWFHGATAMAYAVLGLTDRVQDLYDYHINRVTVIERALAAPNFAYALARSGNFTRAKSVVPDILAAIGNDERRKSHASATLRAAPVWLAIGALEAGEQREFDRLVLEARSVVSIYRKIEFINYWSANPVLLNAMIEKFDACLESRGFKPRRSCAKVLVRLYASGGRVDEAIATGIAGDLRSVSGEILESLFEFGHFDEALDLCRSELESCPFIVVAKLGAMTDPALSARAEELALAQQDFDDRDRLLEFVAESHAEVGDFVNAVRVVNQISVTEVRDAVTGRFAQMRVDGLGRESRFAEAAAALRHLERAQAVDAARRLVRRAVRQKLK